MLFTRIILATALVLVGLLLEAEAKDWEGAAYRWLYSVPLTIPPVKTPVRYVEILDSPAQHGLTTSPTDQSQTQ